MVVSMSLFSTLFFLFRAWDQSQAAFYNRNKRKGTIHSWLGLVFGNISICYIVWWLTVVMTYIMSTSNV